MYAVKVALVRASTHALELSWTATTFAAAYVLQIQKIEQAQVIAAKASQTTTQQPVAADTNDTESAKSQISVIHIGGSTGIQSVTGATKPAIDKTTPSIQLPSSVKAVTSHTKPSLTTSAVQVQPQISIISSTATGGATGGLLQKLRPSANTTKNTTGSIVSSASTEATVAVRVATSVAPSGSIVLSPAQTANTANSTATTSLRFIPSMTSVGQGPGQTLRLAATYCNSPSNSDSTGSTSTTTTILKTAQPSATVQKSGSITTAGGATGTTSSLGGKQYFIQKPLTLAPNVQLQFVKTTSGGMAVQTLPKVNFNLAKGSNSAQSISVCNQQLSQGSTQIQVRYVRVLSYPNLSRSYIYLKIASGSNAVNTKNIMTSGAPAITSTAGIALQQKPIVSGNVLKLVSPHTVAGGKLIMKNSNILQMGKVASNVMSGKPAFVITNKQGAQIGNQQIIIVTTASNLRSVSAGSVMSNAGSSTGIVSIVGTTGTTATPITVGGSRTVISSQGNLKMVRNMAASASVAGTASGTGRPITLTLPSSSSTQKSLAVTSLHSQKTAVYIGGKPVTVMSGSSAGGGSSGANKLVMLPGATATARKGFVNIFNTGISTTSGSAGGSQRTLTLATGTRSTPTKSAAMPLKEKDNSGVESSVAIATMANEAYMDADPIDDIIEQLDGAGDLIKPNHKNNEALHEIENNDEDIAATSTSIVTPGVSAAFSDIQKINTEPVEEISSVSSTTDAPKTGGPVSCERPSIDSNVIYKFLRLRDSDLTDSTYRKFLPPLQQQRWRIISRVHQRLKPPTY